ncbi:28S ribosomal protein S9, mitochondrial [Leptopilina heterotoma]|uniref:28S ribosomal protein S9, mitochondrial n=1 Tax=Leptopilina heterotoma TaxID=63436 RepID=UPI001CA924BF|nr:28S ribosomal protein S9, mitochondrial [Leptopilina heterotoma]
MAFSSSRAFICYLSKNNSSLVTKNANFYSLLSITNCQIFNKCSYSAAKEEIAENLADELESAVFGGPSKKISKSMKAYLERSKEHNEFMQKARAEYQIGKRHLANMMGENPDNFSQDDINKAIEYLFPSGVFDKKAKPMMKPPDEIFPPRKAAEFDESGRPFHSMFYTCRPNYYQTLHKIADEIHKLNEKEDKLYMSGSRPDDNVKIDLETSVWLTNGELEKVLFETVPDNLYEYFINTMDRLAAHPVSYEAKEFIMKYRKELQNISDSVELLPMQYDADGRPFVCVPDCKRKSARGQVILRGEGTGKISINGENIRYFNDWQSREQCLRSTKDQLGYVVQSVSEWSARQNDLGTLS